MPSDLIRYADLALTSLSRFAPLSEGEKEDVIAAIASADIVLADSELLAEGQALRSPRIVLAGWAARVRVLSDGRRQILSFVIPGDLYGLSPRPRSFALSPTVALTPVAFAPVEGVHEAMTSRNGHSPSLATAGWSSLALEEVLLFNHVTRLGCQSAYERVAHLFLELYHRLTAVGLAADLALPLPLTQEILSDALGLSVVHTNRTLQHLRRDGFIEYHNGTVRLENTTRLAELVDFRVPPKLQKN